MGSNEDEVLQLRLTALFYAADPAGLAGCPLDEYSSEAEQLLPKLRECSKDQAEAVVKGVFWEMLGDCTGDTDFKAMAQWAHDIANKRG